MSGLTAFQVEVARLFFGLPASEGFLLAGGGALLASGLTDRPTHDLDPGFDRVVLAEMMSTLDRFDDNELPIGNADVTSVRTFFADWARELWTDA